MSSPGEQRKLAAIMFTDMVGYSALSQRDDKLAIELLEEHRELLRKIFPEFNGMEIKTIGDAFLVEFNSALEAAQCAIEIQRTLAKRNADAPAGRQIELKIGIHIGDVVHRGGDVYGDGVNIASRIEPLAGAGGICVSMDVERQIRNAVETRLEKLAPTELKNISVPMELFRIVLPWERKSEVKDHKSELRERATAPTSRKFTLIGGLVLLLVIGIGWWWTTLPHKNPASTALKGSQPQSISEKSIAVLPFENLSDDKSNAYFADGIQDEILTRLSKIADLKVISRTSTQHYKSAPENLSEIARQLGVAHILEGSVQKSGGAVRVNVQLIKAANDSHLWADTFDRQLTDIFSVESEVARTIADQLRAKLTGPEEQVITEKPTQNSAAYDAYLRGTSIERNQSGFESAKAAGAAYAEAVRIDPSFAVAWANLAIIRSRLYLYGVDATTNTAAATREAADKAMSLQPDLAEAWMAQAAYRYRVSRDFRGAVQAYEEASKRLPNGSQILVELAVVETRLGSWNSAEAHWRKAMDLDPQNSGLLSTVAIEFLSRLRRYSEAHALLDRISGLSPDDQWFHAARVDLFLREGRLGETAKELARIPADSLVDAVVSERALLLTWQRQFDSAIAIIERKINSAPPREPLDEWNKILLMEAAYCHEWAGRPEQAKALFTRALHEINPSNDAVLAPKGFGMPVYLALTYAGLGEKDKALQQAHLAIEQYADDGWVKPDAEAALAQIQARFGDTDAAIAAIPHLLEVPAGTTHADLLYDQLWDPLRKDPRFEKLCQESAK